MNIAIPAHRVWWYLLVAGVWMAGFSCSRPESDEAYYQSLETLEKTLRRKAARQPDSMYAVLQKRLSTAAPDSMGSRIVLLNVKAVTESVFLGRPDTAWLTFALAEQLCESVHRPNWYLGKTHNNRSICHKNHNELAPALFYAEKSIEARRADDDTLGLSRSYNSISQIYRLCNLTDSALHYAYEALQLKLLLADTQGAAKTWITLANLECDVENWSRAAGLFHKAYAFYHRQGHEGTLDFATACYGLGNVKQALAEYDSAIYYYQIALGGWKSAQNTHMESIVLDALGSTYAAQNRLVESMDFLYPSYLLARSTNDDVGVVTGGLHLSDCLQKLGDVDSAQSVLEQARKAAHRLRVFVHLRDVYYAQSELFRYQHRYDSALASYTLHTQYRDSFNGELMQKSRVEYNVRFQTEKLRADNLVIAQQRDKQAKRNREFFFLIVGLIAAVLIIALVGYLVRQRLRSRLALAEKNREIQARELDEKVREMQMEKMTGLMEGQEMERDRISRELHDSLGGLLATVKVHFSLIEEKMDRQLLATNKTRELLDEASQEVRRISHNMASNVLAKFGLLAALQDLVETVNQSGQVRLILNTTQYEDRLDGKEKIHVFRIVQEAVSNILKHSRATKASIDLTMWNDHLNIMVVDNGVGFSVDEAEKKMSMGLENLKARVSYLNGSIEIDTGKGGGTTLVIDLMI